MRASAEVSGSQPAHTSRSPSEPSGPPAAGGGGRRAGGTPPPAPPRPPPPPPGAGPPPAAGPRPRGAGAPRGPRRERRAHRRHVEQGDPVRRESAGQIGTRHLREDE